MSTVEGYIGIAKKARKVVSGASLMDSIRQKKVALVLIAADASDRTRKQFTDKCITYQIPCLIWGTVATISSASGMNMRVAIGISDHGLANSIREYLK
jgi:ribosomal protein L7Ae-like RNA K-turn-binding protein